MLKSLLTSSCALLLLAPAALAGSVHRVTLEPRPLVQVDSPAGDWELRPDGRWGAKAHELAPVVTLDGGLLLELSLPGHGPLGMHPLALRTGTRALPPGDLKLAEAAGPRLLVESSWLGVDEELVLQPGLVKHDLLVSRAALETLGGGDLRAEWRLDLPDGVAAGLEPGSGLVLRGAGGRFLARVPEPVIADAGEGHAHPGLARLDWDGRVLGVVVPASWLADPAREFPLRIDPTATVFPSGNFRTGFVDQFGNRNDGAIDSGSLVQNGFGNDVRGYAEFDTSPIPDGATILGVDLEVWLSNHDNPLDPAVPLQMEVKQVGLRASAPALQLHAEIGDLGEGPVYASELVPRTGSRFCPDSYAQRVYDLGSQAAADLKSRILDDWFTIGFASEIVTDPDFDHIDYIGFPETVQNFDCPTTQFPGTRIRLHVEYTDDLPPVCNPGGPYAFGCPDRPLALDGSASFDPEGQPLTYLWTTDCPGVVIDADQAVATLQLDEPCRVICSVTLLVSDGVNEAECVETVSLADEARPFLTGLPPNDSAPCDEIPPVGMPGASDDCDPAPVVAYLGEFRRAGSCPDSYTLVRRWQATDRCGQSSPTGVQEIEVRDDEPPVLENLPPDETVGCAAIPPPGAPTATDDCDPNPGVNDLGETREDGACPDSYTLVRRWEAQDRCGNLSPVGEQRITVTDDEAPVLGALPPDETVSCAAVPPPVEPSAMDDCDPAPAVVYLGETREDGPCEDSYTLVRRWEARDRCGNASPVSERRITVVDDAPPLLQDPPADESVSCDGIPPVAAPSALDACDPAPLVNYLGEIREDGPCRDSYTLRRRWEAVDRCGNASPVHEQVITVTDAEPPELLGVPADAFVSCDAVPPPEMPGAIDDCDPAPVVEYLGEVREDGSCPDSYRLRRSWEAVDRCGNRSAPEEQVITVTDSTPPVLAGVPADAEVSCDAVPPPAMPTATDDCDPAPRIDYLGETRTDGPCPDSYLLTRRWEAVDRCANVSPVVEQVITVTDSEAPVLAGVPADASVSCDAVPPPAMPTATDDCDPAPTVDYLGEVREDGACPDSYTLRRQWQAVDRCGNRSAVEEQVIEVSDSSAPVLSGVPADVVVECDAVPPPAAVVASDDCDPAPAVSFDETRADGACPGEYTLTRTWTATDRCGNASSASQVVSVVDTTPPVVTPPPAGDLACLWPPNHRYVCFDLDGIEVEASDSCSEPVTLELEGCVSNQPDDAKEEGSDYNGDGRTEDDCIVLDGGSRVCVRAERAGAGPDAQDGRRYGLLVVAVDACGNRSEPVSIGSIHVPHDQSPSADCIDSTKRGEKRKTLRR